MSPLLLRVKSFDSSAAEPMQKESKTMEHHPGEQKETIEKLSAAVVEMGGRLHIGDITLREINLALAALKEGQTDAAVQTQKMYNRMFIDNGKKSFQSVMSNNAVHIRLQWFFIGGMSLTVICGAIKMIWFSQ